ncbi:DUF6355 family natural product biosynthesis protein [Streptomyces sp. NPDC000941]
MKRIPLKRATAAAAVIASAGLLSVGASTVAAAAPSGGASVQACGYYETSTDKAYYGHCGSGRVIIKIELDWTTAERFRCVGPGETYLGTTDEIDYAVYVGTC